MGGLSLQWWYFMFKWTQLRNFSASRGPVRRGTCAIHVQFQQWGAHRVMMHFQFMVAPPLNTCYCQRGIPWNCSALSNVYYTLKVSHMEPEDKWSQSVQKVTDALELIFLLGALLQVVYASLQRQAMYSAPAVFDAQKSFSWKCTPDACACLALNLRYCRGGKLDAFPTAHLCLALAGCGVSDVHYVLRVATINR